MYVIEAGNRNQFEVRLDGLLLARPGIICGTLNAIGWKFVMQCVGASEPLPASLPRIEAEDPNQTATGVDLASPSGGNQ